MWTLWHTSYLVSMRVHSCHLILMSIQMLLLFQLEMPVNNGAKQYQPETFLIQYWVFAWYYTTLNDTDFSLPLPKIKGAFFISTKTKLILFVFTHVTISYPVATECAMWVKQIVLPTWCWYWWSWSVIVVSYFPSGALTLASFQGSPGTRICIHGESLIHVSFLIWAWHNPKRTRVFRTGRHCFAYCSTDYPFNTRCVWYSTSNS